VEEAKENFKHWASEMFRAIHDRVTSRRRSYGFSYRNPARRRNARWEFRVCAYSARNAQLPVM